MISDIISKDLVPLKKGLINDKERIKSLNFEKINPETP